MSCKCKPTECEECPEWIFTFADLVMLMMGFFVILWVLKPAPNPKSAGGPPQDEEYIKVAAAIRQAFGYVPNPASKDPVDMAMLLHKLQTVNLQGPHDKGQATRPREGAKGVEDDVTSIRSSKQATDGGRLLFDPGQGVLRPELAEPLNEIADLIRGHRTIVLIKGHAALDDLGEHATDAQRMELSLKRAQAVANYLIGKGVSPEILRVEGCSTFEPVTERAYTLAGRAANRRVEVEATSNLVDRYQDPAATQPALGD